MVKYSRIFYIFIISAIVAFFLLPVFAIIYHAGQAEYENLSHLWQTVLVDYVINSLLLVIGTVFFSLVWAMPCAWLLANYQFPTHQILQWMLCLPLAIPAYLIGYLYTDLLDYAGPVQATLRSIFSWHDSSQYWFPPIRSLVGACVVLSLILYPYIFLLVRVSLLAQSENLVHSAKTLGFKGWLLFKRVTLPLIRPAIIVGASLVAMETLGDFGLVSYFAIPTLTTAIYDAWLGFGDLATAAQISLFMLVFIFALLSLERYSRKKQKIYQRGYEKNTHLKRLKGWKSIGTICYCWGLITIAFFIPFIKLAYWALLYFQQSWTVKLWQYAYHSLLVSSIAAIVGVVFSLLLLSFSRVALQYGKKYQDFSSASLRLSSLGYAIPGTILAIGLLIPYAFADHQLNGLLKFINITPIGLIFSGTMFALISAYIIRFSAMAIGSIDTELNKIPPSIDMASRTLGKSGIKMFFAIHLPQLSKGIFTALILLFIESMKELNASLLLRPFNFDTLATHVFAFTSDEQLEKAALPAILIVLVSLLPIIFLTRSLIGHPKKG